MISRPYGSDDSSGLDEGVAVIELGVPAGIKLVRQRVVCNTFSPEFFMATLNRTWRRGALVGLVIGASVSVAAWSGVFPGGAEFVQFLAAVPPFLLDALRATPEALQALIIVIWWGLAGTAVGWGLGRNAGGKAFAVLLIANFIYGHIGAVAVIEKDLRAATRAMEGLLKTLFGN